MTDAMVFARRVRPTGEPPRCAVCGAVCEPSLVGPARCSEHVPRQKSRLTLRTRPAEQPSRQAMHQAKQRAEAKAAAEALPVASRTAAIPTLGERLRARRAHENGERT
jgi:hypothetical protein